MSIVTPSDPLYEQTLRNLSAASGPVAYEDLIAWYYFPDDSDEDQGPNSLGSLTKSGASINITGGVIDDNGAADRYYKNSLPSFDWTDHTLMAWVRVFSPNNFGVMVGISDSSSNNKGIGIIAESNRDVGLVKPGVAFYFTNENMGNGVWNHVAYTTHGTSNIRLYLNGSDISGLHSVGNTVTTTPDLMMGSVSTGQFPQNGEYDDIRVYGRALSAAEIEEAYNEGRQ